MNNRRNRQTQQGSSHLILVIVLVILILSGLGYVYWLDYSNINKNRPIDIDASSNQSIDISNNSNHSINVEEWGLTGSYQGDVPLIYKVNGDNLRFGYNYSFNSGPSASINRYKGNVKFLSISEYELESMSYFAFYDIDKQSTIEDFFNNSGQKLNVQRQIGDYYYFMGSNINISYAQCKPDSSACYKEEEAAREMGQVFESLKPI